MKYTAAAYLLLLQLSSVCCVELEFDTFTAPFVIPEGHEISATEEAISLLEKEAPLNLVETNQGKVSQKTT